MDDLIVHENTYFKYKRIVERTIIESNRVLSGWSLNNKRHDVDDENSLITGFLVKFIKEEFSYKNGRNIGRYMPLFVVKDDRVMSISFSNMETNYYAYTRELTNLGNYLKTFDFVAFDKTLLLNEMLSNNVEKTPISELNEINFDDIKQIKF